MTNKLMEQVETILKEKLISDCDLMQIVSNINSWNGSLEHLEYYYNDEEFFEIFFTKVMGAVRAVCFGEYEFSDDYVKFNAYGNLESISRWELGKELESSIDEIVNALIENQAHVSTDDDEIDSIIELLVNEYVEEMSETEFKDMLIDDYDLDDELIEKLNFKDMTIEQIENIFDEADFSYYTIVDMLEDAVDNVTNGCKIVQVYDNYIVFDA